MAKTSNRICQIELALIVLGIGFLIAMIFTTLLNKHLMQDHAFFMVSFILESLFLCLLGMLSHAHHIRKQGYVIKNHRKYAVRINYYPIIAIFFISILIIPTFGAFTDYIVNLNKQISDLQDKNRDLQNEINTYGQLYPIADKIRTMESNGNISSQDFTTYKKALDEFSTILSLYKTSPGKSQEFVDISYVSDTILSYCKQNILTPQRLHNLMSMMEKNYQFFNHNSSQNSLVFLTYPDSYLPWVYYPGQGVQFQPVSCLNYLQDTYNNKTYDTFLNGLNEFIDYRIDKQIDQKNCTVWEYNFEVYENLELIGIYSNKTWISGMAQGEAVQALGWAYNLTKDSKYLQLANSVMNTFFINWTKGGVADIDPQHNGYWYLEYAFTDRIRVLNGFMVALIGIHDYYNITKNYSAEFLFSKGINELDSHLYQYDVGNWSAYSLISRIASLQYHKFHIYLLRTLYGYTGDLTIKYYADLFQKYLDESGLKI